MASFDNWLIDNLAQTLALSSSLHLTYTQSTTWTRLTFTVRVSLKGWDFTGFLPSALSSKAKCNCHKSNVFWVSVCLFCISSFILMSAQSKRFPTFLFESLVSNFPSSFHYYGLSPSFHREIKLFHAVGPQCRH